MSIIVDCTMRKMEWKQKQKQQQKKKPSTKLWANYPIYKQLLNFSKSREESNLVALLSTASIFAANKCSIPARFDPVQRDAMFDISLAFERRAYKSLLSPLSQPYRRLHNNRQCFIVKLCDIVMKFSSIELAAITSP